MKKRRIAALFVLMLCALLLLPDALLVYHAGRECCPEACPVCALLSQINESLFQPPLAFEGANPPKHTAADGALTPAEARHLVISTPVRQKVRLQD